MLINLAKHTFLYFPPFTPQIHTDPSYEELTSTGKGDTNLTATTGLTWPKHTPSILLISKSHTTTDPPEDPVAINDRCSETSRQRMSSYPHPPIAFLKSQESDSLSS